MEKSYVCLILAKSDSKRLPNKNTLDFNGDPMFLVNVRKCLKIFEKVYVSSDSLEILNKAEKIGANGILRNEDLCGDTPNIPVYQHALKYMTPPRGIVAVQANSPTVTKKTIKECIKRLKRSKEVITVHVNGRIYGSVWGMRTKRLRNYKDFYKPSAEQFVIDLSTDIHTKKDYKLALSI